MGLLWYTVFGIWHAPCQFEAAIAGQSVDLKEDTDMADLPIKALKREERLSDRAAKALESLIVGGVLKSGSRLPPERELAAMFGVSRTVIREAVQNLAARGLLEVRLGDGTVVTGPSADSVSESLRLLLRSQDTGIAIEHLHEVRRVLEVEIAERAAERATDEDISDLGAIVQELEAQRDVEASARLDVEFHRALAVAAHNPLFIILLDSIGGLLLAIRRTSFDHPETASKARYHHRNIFEQVTRRDPGAARQAMSSHLDESEDTMRSVLKNSGRTDLLLASLD
jgi:GntR family transcriptional repressor for pyruvate dehydrogenase complex